MKLEKMMNSLRKTAVCQSALKIKYCYTYMSAKIHQKPKVVSFRPQFKERVFKDNDTVWTLSGTGLFFYVNRKRKKNKFIYQRIENVSKRKAADTHTIGETKPR